MKKYTTIVLMTLSMLFLAACGKKDAIPDQVEATFQATILEIKDSHYLVEPVEGSQELKSSDQIMVPIKFLDPSLEPEIGDVIEIRYDGMIAESYPAQIHGVYGIKVIEEAETIPFHDKTFNKADLSQETIEWLEWYNDLSEEEQLAINYIPTDLYELCGYPTAEDQELQIVDSQENNSTSQNEQILELDASYEKKDFDFLFQYPAQWMIKEDPWWPATETNEAAPEKTVNLIINDTEEIVIFDSQSIDGGLFSFVSGEETEIINVLDIKGTMITETIETEGEEPQMRVLAYYEDGYEPGIGMGGSYGACAKIRKSTYEQYKELIVELFKSIRMKQS